MNRTPLAAASAAVVLLSAPAFAQESTYIALGDSITFGETDLRYIPSDGTNTGYPTRVQDAFGIDNLLNFAIDGETADSFQDNTGRTPPVVGRTDVPLQLQNTNYDPDDLIPQQQRFLNAVADQRAMGNTVELVTITLGFNEVAALASEPDPLAQLPATLAAYRDNYTDVLTTITNTVPDAELALLGYYNPFPGDDNPGTNPAAPLFAQAGPQLNAIIADLADQFDAAFVPTADAFVGREAELTFIDEVGFGDAVPEPHPFGDGTAPIGNVHPNAAGYDVIAGRVIAAVPEPATAGVVALAGALCLRRRGR